MTWQEDLARIVYPSIFERAGFLNESLVQWTDIANKHAERNLDLERENYLLAYQVSNQEEKLTPIEEYCTKHFKKVNKFAYKDKGRIGSSTFPVYPNEMIQPDSFLVVKERRKIPKATDKFLWYGNIGKHVDKILTWTKDKQVHGFTDIYPTPADTLTLKHEDCDGHAFLVSSIEPEIGLCFGFYKKEGHAFNCFVYEQELYILETNAVFDKNKNFKIQKYLNQEDYKIHFIFTKDNTYELDGSVHFGEVIQ